MRAVVLGPHLDDAVLSAGRFLAASPEAVVVTVFAGIPSGSDLTDYDRSCGFATSRQAMSIRRQEDRRALEILRGSAVHLEFLDGQYQAERDDDEIAGAIRTTILSLGPDIVLGPVGITHPDHRILGRIWSAVVRDVTGLTAFAYADLPYAVGLPPSAAAQIEEFTEVNNASPVDLPSGDTGLKAQALLAYATQLRNMCALDCLESERFWRIGSSIS